MNINQRKEDFSKAYLKALAAQSGWAIASWSQDHFKIDSSLSKSVTHEDGFEEVLHLDFQLKCTESPTTDNAEFVSFTLKPDHYDALKKRVGGKPMLFCVVIVPDSTAEWVKLVESSSSESHRSTHLKHCGYVAFISDEEGNYLQGDKTIRFSKASHAFDSTVLDQIEKKLKDPQYRLRAVNAEKNRWEGRNNE